MQQFRVTLTNGSVDYLYAEDFHEAMIIVLENARECTEDVRIAELREVK
jgi:predicted transcriptional regulator